jgi:acyl-coenzyme A thioesterase PaaI-like protein
MCDASAQYASPVSLRDRILASPRTARIAFNAWPCIRGTGARVEHIAPDWSELRVRLPLKLRTRNYVGTIFGGSMYGAVDPFLMLMLIKRLGPGYVVWDKAATIRFRRPGTRTLSVTFHVTDAELEEIRREVDEAGGTLDRTWTIELVDPDGAVCASVDKVLYVATKDADRARRAARGA